MMEKPLLLIDVDGPLNPWMSTITQAKKAGYERYMMNPMKSDGRKWQDAHGTCLRVFLNPQHGEQLLKLAELYELVWCTTWEHDANSLIGPRIGLPKLPVIEFGKYCPPQPPSPGLHWKTAVIVGYAKFRDRPFAWVDDEIRPQDAVWFQKWCDHPNLTMPVDASTGLTDTHFRELREWAEGGGYVRAE